MTHVFVRVSGAIFALCLIFTAQIAEACSRFVLFGKDGIVISARNQDWKEDIDSKFWKFPRGMVRNGAAGANPVEWTSQYGSVVISGYDLGTAEGVNEESLAVHLLWLADSDYGDRSDAPTLSIGIWAQYVLDNYATTADAVAGLEALEPQLIAPSLPTGHKPTVHISITDKTGDSAIVEYIDGRQVIHHSRDYSVMTNEPAFSKQLVLQEHLMALADYDALPGSSTPVDRFTRISYYLDAIPPAQEPQEALATARSILETVTVPRNFSLEDRPNISTTVYRSLFDHANKVYYYQGTYTPHFFWVDVTQFDFEDESVLMLDTESGTRILSGEVSSLFVPAEPFEFLSD
jgi:choloylglycine hydrolase